MLKWIYRYKKYFIAIGAFSLAIPLLYISYKVITTKGNSTTINLNFPNIIGYIIITYYIILLSLILVFLVNWFIKNFKLFVNLKNEKHKTELLHLQSQVNPHFFFNMLNNLYGLVDKDSDKAKKLILKLSDMMRYSIYEGQKQSVSLQEEIEFINNYIALHKMRYHKNIDISFNHNIKNQTTNITPLLFIILVENAFKHGVEVLRNNAYVTITLQANDTSIYFMVENNYDEKHTPITGIGLQNLTRRLALLYPKKHTFSTSKNKGIFKTELTIYYND